MEPIKKLFQAKVFYKYGEKKAELDILQDQLLSNIPNQIRPHVKVKGRVKGVMVLEVASNAIAHKIKMTSSSISNCLGSSKQCTHCRPELPWDMIGVPADADAKVAAMQPTMEGGLRSWQADSKEEQNVQSLL